MTLDDIAESIGTVTDEQDDDTEKSVSDDDQPDTLDVQDEYDGGWSNDH